MKKANGRLVPQWNVLKNPHSSVAHSGTRMSLFDHWVSCISVQPINTDPLRSTRLIWEAQRINVSLSQTIISHCVGLFVMPSTQYSLKYQVCCPPVLPLLSCFLLILSFSICHQMKVWVAMQNQRGCVHASQSLSRLSILFPVWKRPWKRWELT